MPFFSPLISVSSLPSAFFNCHVCTLCQAHLHTKGWRAWRCSCCSRELLSPRPWRSRRSPSAHTGRTRRWLASWWTASPCCRSAPQSWPPSIYPSANPRAEWWRGCLWTPWAEDLHRRIFSIGMMTRITKYTRAFLRPSTAKYHWLLIRVMGGCWNFSSCQKTRINPGEVRQGHRSLTGRTHHPLPHCPRFSI